MKDIILRSDSSAVKCFLQNVFSIVHSRVIPSQIIQIMAYQRHPGPILDK